MNTLNSLSPINLRYDLPQPTWHGHFQSFLRLDNSSPYMFIDLVVIHHNNQKKFLENEIHGQPIIHFDKMKLLSKPNFDRQNQLALIQQRLQVVPLLFNFFQVLIKKEIFRNNPIEAVAYYQSMTLKPLMELMRIRFSPQHYNFNTRYVYYELPKEILEQIEPLYFPNSLEDIANKRELAESLFNKTLSEIDLNQIEQHLKSLSA